jgi:choline dehydrogenase-like flavoprotein
MTTAHYDFMIIGTGAGGGTLAYKLAPTGKKILILERGSFLPREKANWDTVEVVHKDRYHTNEVWYDQKGQAIHPGTGYFVGGNTKVYGGALFRWREQDFNQVVHKGGISPEWPLKYRDFEPYYTEAEKLYEVHGKRGLDPTEPDATEDYPYPAIRHEPRIQEIHDSLKGEGYHPFYLPLAIKLNEVNRRLSACIRCNTCDGFPCLVDAKADADVNCVRPAEQSVLGVSFRERHTFEAIATHSVDWWLTAEDLPDPNNRVTLRGDSIQLHYTENNTEAYNRLVNRWMQVLKMIGCGERIIPASFYFRKKLPLQGVAHQCGTCRFGEDPQTSVLDINCRTHDIDNLYVVDGSFFCSSAAVNPTLTIIANALLEPLRALKRRGFRQS